MNTDHRGSRPAIFWVSLALSPPDRETAKLFEDDYLIRFSKPADLANGSLTELSGAAGICFECDWLDASEMALVSEVKRRNPSIPVVLLTAHLTVEIATWAIRSRIFDCLAKPLKQHEVDACLERLSAARAARREQNARSSIAPSPTEARQAGNHGGKGRMDWAMSEIRRRLHSRPSETDMANLCRLSPTRFSRLFRRETGMTFQQFVAKARFDLSSRLLMESDLPISEISLRVGLDDPAYFARFFRREAGVTPSDFRLRSRCRDRASALDGGENEAA